MHMRKLHKSRKAFARRAPKKKKNKNTKNANINGQDKGKDRLPPPESKRKKKKKKQKEVQSVQLAGKTLPRVALEGCQGCQPCNFVLRAIIFMTPTDSQADCDWPTTQKLGC